MLIAPMLGVVFFGGLILAYWFAFELLLIPVIGEPAYSYGQQSFLSLFCCGLLGATAGLILVVVCFPRTWPALSVPLLGAALLSWLALGWWQESLAEYGPDSSDYFVFVPMLGASALVVVLSVAACVFRVLPSWMRRRVQ
jgi:hypothetical protein